MATTVEPVDDLLDPHAARDVDRRLVGDLAPLRDLAVTSGLPFSLVRYQPWLAGSG